MDNPSQYGPNSPSSFTSCYFYDLATLNCLSDLMVVKWCDGFFSMILSILLTDIFLLKSFFF